MRIETIEVTPFSIPLHKPLIWANGSMDVADWLLVKVVSDDGTYGVSEAIPRPMIYGETQRSIDIALRDFLIPAVVGRDSFSLESIWRAMNGLAANLAAKSAIDVALHDLNGKLTGLPVSRLLGGPARQWVDLVWMVGMADEAGMVAEAVDRAGEGFRSFKVKGGLDSASDIRVIRSIREKLPSARLYIDANNRYSRETALRVLRDLDGVLEAVEEPVAAQDDDGRLMLTRQVPGVPILGDDSVFTVADVQRQLRLGSLGRISLKVPRTGFTLSRKIVALAEAGNVPLQVATQSETTLGTAACLHLSAAFEQISLPGEMVFYRELTGSLLTKEPIVEDGAMRVPDVPGLGVEIDWDKVRRYEVKL